jgi:hypothetical protein
MPTERRVNDWSLWDGRGSTHGHLSGWMAWALRAHMTNASTSQQKRDARHLPGYLGKRIFVPGSRMNSWELSLRSPIHNPLMTWDRITCVPAKWQLWGLTFQVLTVQMFRFVFWAKQTMWTQSFFGGKVVFMSGVTEPVFFYYQRLQILV